MNITLFAADLTTRIKAMAQDSNVNNERLITGLLKQYGGDPMKNARRAAEELFLQHDINSFDVPRVTRIIYKQITTPNQ